MKEQKLKVVLHEKHADSGLIVLHLRIVEIDEHGNTMEGPIELHSFPASVVMDNHGGSLRRLIGERLKPLMMHRFENHKFVDQEALNLTGEMM